MFKLKFPWGKGYQRQINICIVSEKEIQDLFTEGQFTELITQFVTQSDRKFTSEMYYILSLAGSDKSEEAYRHLDKLTIIPENELEEYAYLVAKLRVFYRTGRLNEFKMLLDSESLLINKELSRVTA